MVEVPVWRSSDGRATLYNGDCRQVMRGLDAASIDAVITDPPYGHNNNNGDLIAKREAALGRGTAGPPRPIANDGPEANELFCAAIAEWARLLRPGCCCCCCCCGGGGPDPQFARWSLWLDEALEFKQAIVWDKGPMGMGWHYRRSYEMVLVAQAPGGPCRWFDRTRKVENVIRPGHAGICKIIPSDTEHPTPKPIALAEFFLAIHTQPGDTVLDPFCGCGWVGSACMRTGRRFVGIEIDPGYYNIARRRIEAEMAQMRLFV